MLNFCLTREAYFAIRGSLDSNSALAYPMTNCESLRLKRLLAPKASTSSSPAIMASYSNSLLEALKPRQTVCSILSPVGEVNCRLMPAPDCLEAPSTQRVHQPFSFGKYWAAGFLQGSRLRPTPSLKASACTRCHIRLVSLPIEPSFRTYPVYESCPGAKDQLVPQRDEPGSMAKLLGGCSRAKASHSRWVHLVSASVKDLLTKNTDLNFVSPHSLNKVTLTAILEAAR